MSEVESNLFIIIAILLSGMFMVIASKVIKRNKEKHMHLEKVAEFLKSKGGKVGVFNDISLQMKSTEDSTGKKMIFEIKHNDTLLEEVSMMMDDFIVNKNKPLKFKGAWDSFVRDKLKKLMIESNGRGSRWSNEMVKEEEMAVNYHKENHDTYTKRFL